MKINQLGISPKGEPVRTNFNVFTGFDLLLRYHVWEGPELGVDLFLCEGCDASAFQQYASAFGIEIFAEVRENGRWRDDHKVPIPHNAVLRTKNSFAMSIKLLRSYVEVIADSIPKFLLSTLSEQAAPFSSISKWASVDFVSHAKYVTAYPVAYYLRTTETEGLMPMPACPPNFTGSPILYVGRIGKMIKDRMNSFNTGSSRFFFGLLQGVKRGCAPVPRSYLKKSLLSHREKMTVIPNTDLLDLQATLPFFDTIFSSFVEPTPILLEATTSASAQTKSSEGGARAYLRDYYGKGLISSFEKSKSDPEGAETQLYRDPVSPALRLLLNSNVVGLSEFFPEDIDSPDFSSKSVESHFSGPVVSNTMFRGGDAALNALNELPEWRALWGDHSQVTADIPKGRIERVLAEYQAVIYDKTEEPAIAVGAPEYTDLLKMVEIAPGVVTTIRGLPTPDFKRVLGDASRSESNVIVIALIEPLKVRLISKGDSHRYWISRFFQKAVWKYMQKFPQFSLTGRIVGPVDFDGILDREKRLGLGDLFNFWVSGDYSAATDGLDINYTKAAFEAILARCQGMSDELKNVLRSVLYEQDLEYPPNIVSDKRQDKWTDAENELYRTLRFAKQTNGQLMGSTLSFPILCVINLVCYWRALEEYLERPVDVMDLPVLINGDDILFRTNSVFYAVWLKYIGLAGFALSQGKNYVHASILTVNSAAYRHTVVRNGDVSYDRFVELGYMNVGHLTGQSKRASNDDSAEKPIWDIYNSVTRSAVDPVRAHHRFVHYNKTQIKSLTSINETTTINLFVPRPLGGLGFIKPMGLEVRITGFQRKLATYVEGRNIDSLKSGEIPSNTTGLVKEREMPGFFRLPRSERPNLNIKHETGVLEYRNIQDVLLLNEVVAEERNIRPSVLANPPTKKLALRAKLPSKETLADFRGKQGGLARMRIKDMLLWERKIVEVKELIPPPPNVPISLQL